MKRPFAHIPGVVYPDASAAGAALGKLGGEARAKSLPKEQQVEQAKIAATIRHDDRYLTAAQKADMNPPLCGRPNCVKPCIHFGDCGYEGDYFQRFCSDHREEHLQKARDKYARMKKNQADRAAGLIPPEPVEINFKIDGANRAAVEAAAKASGWSVEEWAAHHLLWAATLPSEARSAVEKQDGDYKAEIQRCLDQMVKNGELIATPQGEGEEPLYQLPKKQTTG